MNEETAIHLCLEKKDPRGFDFLVKQYRREAMAHALGFMGNREDALDMCQESFKRAFIAMPKLQRLEQFYPWFYTILKNCCLNTIARKNTAIRHFENVQITQSQNHPSESPLLALQKTEEREGVWSILSQLSEDHREILILKYFKDMKYEQISETLGIPRGTVMSRLFAARKSFADHFPPKGVS